jgi:hypothetical protein
MRERERRFNAVHDYAQARETQETGMPEMGDASARAEVRFILGRLR